MKVSAELMELEECLDSSSLEYDKISSKQNRIVKKSEHTKASFFVSNQVAKVAWVLEEENSIRSIH